MRVFFLKLRSNQIQFSSVNPLRVVGTADKMEHATIFLGSNIEGLCLLPFEDDIGLEPISEGSRIQASACLDASVAATCLSQGLPAL